MPLFKHSPLSSKNDDFIEVQSLCKDDRFKRKENIISLQNALAREKLHLQLWYTTLTMMPRKRNAVTNPDFLTLFSRSTEDTAMTCKVKSQLLDELRHDHFSNPDRDQMLYLMFNSDFEY